jgi:hypothetical protein
MRSTGEVLDHHLKCFENGIWMPFWQTTQRTRCFVAPKEHCVDRKQSGQYSRGYSPSSLNLVRPLFEGDYA